jgi:hypothetical protein
MSFFFLFSFLDSDLKQYTEHTNIDILHFQSDIQRLKTHLHEALKKPELIHLYWLFHMNNAGMTYLAFSISVPAYSRPMPPTSPTVPNEMQTIGSNTFILCGELFRTQEEEMKKNVVTTH